MKNASSKALSIAPTFVLGMGLFGLTQWFTGGDIESDIKLTWYKTVEEGIEASGGKKPLLIDGWAEWCEACKKMDRTTFQDKELRKSLKKGWILVKLDFTDITEEKEALSEKYSMQGLPVTLLLPPSGEVKEGRRLTGYVGPAQMKKEIRNFK